MGERLDDVADVLRRLFGDTPVTLCAHRAKIENRLQEHRVRQLLPPDAVIARQWDGAWVAHRWNDRPVWHDDADLTRAFFVSDGAAPRRILDGIMAREWDSWASRDLALHVRFVVGTRAHPSGMFAASVIARDAAAISQSLGVEVIRPGLHRDWDVAVKLVG